MKASVDLHDPPTPTKATTKQRVKGGPKIDQIATSAYTIPTDAPESDGTLSWDKTTIVIAEVTAGGRSGLGYTYVNAAARDVIGSLLAPTVLGRDAFATADSWAAMTASVRNSGLPGVCACAISAMDTALWDLKARLLDIPLADLFGCARDRIAVYGSGGFTSYSDARLSSQLAAWVEDLGCRAVKMKVGRTPDDDPRRVALARKVIGDAELFVDANGAFSRKQALGFAQRVSGHGVVWFEEPVSSDDLEGLRLMRDRAPGGMDIAAGEYGYDSIYFRRMLEAGAVDVLQADVTRCCGYTGFLKVAALCESWSLPLSTHCAASLHAPVACAVPNLRHLEWFHDHAEIETKLFDGAPVVTAGFIAPQRSVAGSGLTFKRKDAERYRV
jgi:L-alanine-DL-glutamate epimerase-like enolase superfamily enzyme